MKQRVLYSLLLISAVVLLDQATKYYVIHYIHPYRTIEILPILNLVNIRNEGAAFGLFRSMGNTFFIAVSIVAVIFMLWIVAGGREDWRIFSLLTGGAVGNLIDRAVRGSVIDFLDVHVSQYHWPAFNVADSALTIGIGLLLISMLKKK